MRVIFSVRKKLLVSMRAARGPSISTDKAVSVESFCLSCPSRANVPPLHGMVPSMPGVPLPMIRENYAISRLVGEDRFCHPIVSPIISASWQESLNGSLCQCRGHRKSVHLERSCENNEVEGRSRTAEDIHARHSNALTCRARVPTISEKWGSCEVP